MSELFPPSFPASRAEALKRFADFLPRLDHYAARRNFVTSSHDAVSRLSPAVQSRLILESEIIDGVLKRFSLEQSEKFVQEVLWRSYWKGWLEWRPQVWRDYRQRLKNLPSQLPPSIILRAAAVAAGRSGVAVMDQFARELISTGYLHNHARMWWASFWIHVEKLPWELGADFFLRYLLDGDAASNTLSWRWVAGLQTRGKCYLVRRSNLERYLAPELLADHAGLDRLNDEVVGPLFLPELSDLTPHTPEPLPIALTNVLQPCGLWLHEEDFSPEIGALGILKPKAIVAFKTNDHYFSELLSPLRRRYLDVVMEDSIQRSKAYYQAPATLVSASSLAEGLVEWATTRQLNSIVTYSAFVGPLNDTLPAVKRALTGRGLTLVLLRRPWDDQFLSYTRSGYFSFWERARKRLISR